MNDEPFGRQLRPVRVTVTEGDLQDRAYWSGRIRAFLEHQPCVIQGDMLLDGRQQTFMLYPDANND